MTVQKMIRVSFAFLKGTIGTIISRGESVVTGMTNNTAYPNPPVLPAALKAMLDSLSAAAAEALDGGRKAVAAKNALLETVVRQLRLLGHYVQVTCNGDMNTFLSSGFEPLSSVRGPDQPLPPATISFIDHGSSGELLVSIKRVANAYSYELRFAPLSAVSAGGPWTTQAVASVQRPASCQGLIPGTVYSFQVRTLGKVGMSDWSDPSMKMCN